MRRVWNWGSRGGDAGGRGEVKLEFARTDTPCRFRLGALAALPDQSRLCLLFDHHHQNCMLMTFDNCSSESNLHNGFITCLLCVFSPVISTAA